MIDEYAFKGAKISSIEIPGSVTEIAAYAFADCTELKSVDFSEGITNIRVSAFSGTGLLSVHLPASLESLSDDAFQLSPIESFTVDENNTAFIAIDGNLYTSDGRTLVLYAVGRTDTYFAIPEGVTEIESYAFYGAKNLEGVFIHSGVSAIGSYVFSGCDKLTIYCEAASEPSGWYSTWNYSSRPVVWEADGLPE